MRDGELKWPLSADSATGSESLASESRKEKRMEDSDYATEGKRMRSETESKARPAAATAASSYCDGMQQVTSEAAPTEVPVVEPVFGTMSVTGRSREMEDAISAQTSLCSPEINQRRPVHLFAVYDGHGGRHVSSLCREKMHVIIEEELMRVISTSEIESAGASTSSREKSERETGSGTEWEERWRRVMTRSFQRMDEVAFSTCACGNVGCDCGCPSKEAALSGSTAVVAVLTSEHIIVANCGDSRAVLCRAGRATPLSYDHKPDRPDELARIEAAGGRVIFVDGARVEGILAMSRAIGDKYLKPAVTSEPDITFTKREAEDECLILASDGMWDVLSNDTACEVASECLRDENREPAVDVDLNSGAHVEEGKAAGALYPSRSALTAALLTRLAVGRKSSDNISVIVVDLKRSRGTNRRVGSQERG